MDALGVFDLGTVAFPPTEIVLAHVDDIIWDRRIQRCSKNASADIRYGRCEALSKYKKVGPSIEFSVEISSRALRPFTCLVH